MLEPTRTRTLRRKSSFGEGSAFEAAIGETRQLGSKTMFCFNTVKTDFSEKAFREAIYKAVLRGSERPRRVNAASGGKKKKKFRLTAEDRKYMCGNLGRGKVWLVCLHACVCARVFLIESLILKGHKQFSLFDRKYSVHGWLHGSQVPGWHKPFLMFLGKKL